MTRLRHAAVTHVGRVRKVNEDSILTLPDQNIWLVADGMGGHSAGDFASQTIVAQVAGQAHYDDPATQMRVLRQSIKAAHATILDEIAARNAGTIGAAVVALMISADFFVCFWAGDCRLYRLREGQIDLLTTDHSLVADLVLAGQMTWDEADHHPQSNAITRAVGVGDELDLDKVRGRIAPGDRYLLCSDGLNKYATFDVLQRILSTKPIETVAQDLLQVALDGGGADNISVIVVDVE